MQVATNARRTAWRSQCEYSRVPQCEYSECPSVNTHRTEKPERRISHAAIIPVYLIDSHERFAAEQAHACSESVAVGSSGACVASARAKHAGCSLFGGGGSPADQAAQAVVAVEKERRGREEGGERAWLQPTVAE